jgi:hypothetical protein
MAGRSVRAIAAGKYDQEARAHDYFGADYGLDFTSPPDISEFKIIRPGESHEVDGPWTTVSFIVDDGTTLPKGYLPLGSYFLQIRVGFWPYFSDLKVWRKKWRDQGYLWSEPLTSIPMPFTVQKDRPIVKCQQK